MTRGVEDHVEIIAADHELALGRRHALVWGRRERRGGMAKVGRFRCDTVY